MKAAARPAREGRAAARAGPVTSAKDRCPTGPEPTGAAAGLPHAGAGGARLGARRAGHRPAAPPAPPGDRGAGGGCERARKSGAAAAEWSSSVAAAEPPHELLGAEAAARRAGRPTHAGRDGPWARAGPPQAA